MSTQKLDLSKIGTGDLEKKIKSGKYSGEILDDMKALLTKRQAKAALDAKKAKATAPKEEKPAAKNKKKDAAPKADAKKDVTKEPAKADAKPPKEKKAKKDEPVKEKKLSIRVFVRALATPKDPKSKVAAVTFSEASEAVLKQFTHREKYHRSEFDTVINALITEGVIEKKKVIEYVASDEVDEVKEVAKEK